MSEQPTPAPQSTRDAANPPHGAARNMSDIARLFLHGARNTPSTGIPKRLGPQDRSPPARLNIHELMPEIPASMPDPKSKSLVTAAPSWELPKVMLGLSGSGDDASWNLLASAAAGLAQDHSTTVCLLGMRDNAFVLELIGHESPDDAPPVTPGAGMADVQVARALFTLRDSVGMWLIAAPDVRSENFTMVVDGVPQWLAATSTQNERVITVYHQMKQAVGSSGPVLPPRAFIVTDDEAAAMTVHGRLRKATTEFLRKDLFFAGVAPMARNAGTTTRIATIPLKPDDRTAVWTAILDELCPPAATQENEPDIKKSEASGLKQDMDIEAALDRVAAASAHVTETSATLTAASHAVFDQLSHVLDPEERAALSADLNPSTSSTDSEIDSPEAAPIPQPAAFDIRDHIARTVPTVTEPAAPANASTYRATPAPSTPSPNHGLTLRAFDLPVDESLNRSVQWQAVERSIRDLVADSILLDARPPMSWATDCCIAIDADGGLHIWTLYKNGVSWYALREWAAEHRNLLALTRRDLVLNRDTDVTVHIVLPLEDGVSPVDGGALADIRSMMRTSGKGVHLYRLCAIQWNARRGIVVAPIG